ncbi:MAG: glycosyltransferase [Aldersonia sp.]|nr:glycosyltransferase [Aldersonia sp.]
MTVSAWVFIAGSRWSEVHGTDANLAMAISRRVPVIWVEPPISAAERVRTRSSMRTRSHDLAPNITAIEITTPPYPSRPILRSVADRHFSAAIRAFAVRRNITVEATVVATPRADFPQLPGERVYLVTDDWLAGAELMGLSPQWVGRKLAGNLEGADITLAVSPVLRDRLVSIRSDAIVHVLPNGSNFDQFDFGTARPPDVPAANYAVLCGQLNERLDIGVLEATVDAGAHLVVIGPVTTRDAGSREAFEKLATHPNVRFTGEKSRAEMVPYLVHASVGITPYVVDSFNRASFPLKTLDYLVAGLPVVSTDLPASRWLEPDGVVNAATPAEFASRVVELSDRPNDATEDRRAKQKTLLAAHSWAARADQLLGLVRGSAGAGREAASRASTA